MPKQKLRELYQTIISEINVLINMGLPNGYCVKLGPHNSETQRPELIDSGSSDLVSSGYLHFKQNQGDIVKHVTRYPGVVFINSLNQFKQLVEQVDKVNQLKLEIKQLLLENGKPAYIKNSQTGERIYATNDLLFETLPMVNQLMLTRKIDYYFEPIKSVSFSWNSDFIHQNIEDFAQYKDKLDKRIPYPPALLSHNEWRLHLEQVKHQVDNYFDQSILVKIIRPKPIEPVIYLAFQDDKPKTIKPKLPVLVYSPSETTPLRKKLSEPPQRPEIIKNGRKYRYKCLSKYLHLYACFKI